MQLYISATKGGNNYIWNVYMELIYYYSLFAITYIHIYNEFSNVLTGANFLLVFTYLNYTYLT